MPEGDRFERSLGAGWRSAFRYAAGEVASDQEIGDKLMDSLAKTLRENGGVPGHDAITRTIVGAHEASLMESFGAFDGIVRDQGGDRHTKVAVDVVAKSFLVQQGVSVPSPDQMARQFSASTCEALIEHYFFDRVAHRLIAEGRFADHNEARQWQGRVEQAMRPRIEKLAGQLVQDPSAASLRAPERVTKKVSTSDLLAEDLGAIREGSSIPSGQVK